MLLDAVRPAPPRRRAEPTPVDAERFRAAARRLAAAVGVVTTDGPAGRHGRTVSAACTVTLDPPTLLVCIDRKGALASAIRANGRFAYSVLGLEARDVAQLFAGSSAADCAARFAAHEWDDLCGAPGLVGAEVAVACSLATTLDVGTHAVFVGTVVEARHAETAARPLVYHDRGFSALTRLAD